MGATFFLLSSMLVSGRLQRGQSTHFLTNACTFSCEQSARATGGGGQGGVESSCWPGLGGGFDGEGGEGEGGRACSVGVSCQPVMVPEP